MISDSMQPNEIDMIKDIFFKVVIHFIMVLISFSFLARFCVVETC